MRLAAVFTFRILTATLTVISSRRELAKWTLPGWCSRFGCYQPHYHRARFSTCAKGHIAKPSPLSPILILFRWLHLLFPPPLSPFRSSCIIIALNPRYPSLFVPYLLAANTIKPVWKKRRHINEINEIWKSHPPLFLLSVIFIRTYLLIKN